MGPRGRRVVASISDQTHFLNYNIMSASSERVKKHRHKVKNKLIELSGSKCINCGYDKCSDALEFHHVDPEAKKFSMAKIKAEPRNWQEVLLELSKCVMLCANCHREVHANLLDIRHLLSENLKKHTPELRTKKPQILNQCPFCQKDKPAYLTFCSSICSNKSRQKVDWSKIDLLEELKHNSSYFMARKLGVSERCIRKHRDKLALRNNVLKEQP